MSAPRRGSPERRGRAASDGASRVALAAGKAFSFGYAEHAELLRAAGADVVEFDPLTDPLPAGTAALVLPGGFPEQFTAELSANDVVRATDRRRWPPAARRCTPNARA